MAERKNFSEEVKKAAGDMMTARGKRSAFWYHARVLGVGGWLFVLPIVAGTYFGSYLDRKLGAVGISWTITCMIIGIAVGAYSVWYFLMRRS